MKAIAICLVLSAWAGSISHETPTGDRGSAKGIRAVIIHGGALQERVIVEDFDAATALYNVFVRGLLHGPPVQERTLAGRECIGFAVFIMRTNALHQPASTLRPADADFRYWFYPAAAGSPAAFMSGTRMEDEIIRRLDALGVPTAATAAATGSCPFERH